MGPDGGDAETRICAVRRICRFRAATCSTAAESPLSASSAVGLSVDISRPRRNDNNTIYCTTTVGLVPRYKTQVTTQL